MFGTLPRPLLFGRYTFCALSVIYKVMPMEEPLRDSSLKTAGAPASRQSLHVIGSIPLTVRLVNCTQSLVVEIGRW